MKITNEQIQKMQDTIDEAKLKREIITKGRPLYELRGTNYGMANYWDGKIVALTEVMYLLGL